MGSATVHDDPHHQHALGLDADVHVGGLAGDREIPAQAGADDRVGRALVELLGLLVADADQAHLDLVLVLDVLERAHHRRQAALHVVGAAADQPVALDSRLELLRAAGHDVEVAVEDHARRALPAGADLGDQHRQAVVIVIAHLDIAGFEPTLDESCGCDEIVRP